MTSYYLDPDFRRDPPKDTLHCVRCQKPITEGVSVTVDWATYQVTKGGPELIGRYCWKVISKSETPEISDSDARIEVAFNKMVKEEELARLKKGKK